MNTFHSALFMHYVIKRTSLAGVMSPTRQNVVVPLHKSPRGGLSPLGILLGDAYTPMLEIKTTHEAITQARTLVDLDNHPLNSVSVNDLEIMIGHHESWVTSGEGSTRISSGEPAPAPDRWLVQLLRDDRGNGDGLALLPATRMIARRALRNNP